MFIKPAASWVISGNWEVMSNFVIALTSIDSSSGVNAIDDFLFSGLEAPPEDVVPDVPVPVKKNEKKEY